jgi:MOSC domain-containing protein YiiM
MPESRPLAKHGTITGVFVGTQKGVCKEAVAQAEMVEAHGISGDVHAGRDARRQVSLIAAEVLRDLAGQGIHYSAGELSANLLTEGVALDALKPGARLRVGAAVLEIVEARKPCGTLTRLDRRLPKLLYRRCGQLARVVTGGAVCVGEAVEVLPAAAAHEAQPAHVI